MSHARSQPSPAGNGVPNGFHGSATASHGEIHDLANAHRVDTTAPVSTEGYGRDADVGSAHEQMSPHESPHEQGQVTEPDAQSDPQSDQPTAEPGAGSPGDPSEWEPSPLCDSAAERLAGEFPDLPAEFVRRCVRSVWVCTAHLGIAHSPQLLERVSREFLVASGADDTPVEHKRGRRRKEGPVD